MAEYKKSGDVEILTLELESHKGEVYNLFDMMMSMEIFEDMYSDSITAKLTLFDTMYLPMYLPILGHETVTFKYSVPGAAEELEYEFVVSSMKNRQHEESGQTNYILDLISADALNNLKTKVSKSYKNKKIDEIVTDLLYKRDTIKPIMTEPSKNTHSFIVPNMTPFKAINWATKFAISTAFDRPTFMFFERQNTNMGQTEYWWKSFETMYSAAPKGEYIVSRAPKAMGGTPSEGLMNEKDRQHSKEAFIVDNFFFDDVFDVARNTTRGMYGARLITHDLTRKVWKKYTHNYVAEFVKDKGMHMKHQDGILTAGDYGVGMDMFSEESKTSMLPTYKDHSPKSKDNDFHIEDSHLKRQGRLLEFDTIKINIEVPGTIWINTGDTLKLKIPRAEPMGDKPEVDDDYWYSDKHQTFLVTAMAQYINKDSFTTIMEVTTESLGEFLPNTQTHYMKKEL